MVGGGQTFDASDSTFQDLLARVVAPGSRVVPFVGAGLNAYGDAAQRLPLWRELLDRLVTKGKQLGLIPEDGDPAIDEAIATNQFIAAMGRIIAALGEPTFRWVVERKLDDRVHPIPPAVTELGCNQLVEDRHDDPRSVRDPSLLRTLGAAHRDRWLIVGMVLFALTLLYRYSFVE